jgi:ATP-dependent DNA helicase RecQ
MKVPVIGLTQATAPQKFKKISWKFRDDVTTFKASFNRPNLYYEVMTKQKM